MLSANLYKQPRAVACLGCSLCMTFIYHSVDGHTHQFTGDILALCAYFCFRHVCLLKLHHHSQNCRRDFVWVVVSTNLSLLILLLHFSLLCIFLVKPYSNLCRARWKRQMTLMVRVVDEEWTQSSSILALLCITDYIWPQRTTVLVFTVRVHWLSRQVTQKGPAVVLTEHADWLF